MEGHRLWINDLFQSRWSLGFVWLKVSWTALNRLRFQSNRTGVILQALSTVVFNILYLFPGEPFPDDLVNAHQQTWVDLWLSTIRCTALLILLAPLATYKLPSHHLDLTTPKHLHQNLLYSPVIHRVLFFFYPSSLIFFHGNWSWR